ncbi:MAG TPA: MerR family transcriptional regulator [Candidatus Binataceae bacterium]|nr:MerR family transcriptional regulator [Candidatus Binataceae bacterium]
MSSTARKSRNAPRKPVETPAPGEERLLRIGEAARLLGVETYVLRFWETQFPMVRPQHTRSRHRFYGPREIETLTIIKRLLHEQRFTIEGARKHIKAVGLEGALTNARGVAGPPARREPARPAPSPDRDHDVRKVMIETRRELESLRRMLDRK